VPVEVVVGTQWGDEGKGKIVDRLAAGADIVARCQGGPNAGHTVVVGDTSYVLHLIPSGALYPQVQCVIGGGVVINPETLFEEIDMLAGHGVDIEQRLRVDPRAHIILPLHPLEERAEEARRGAERIGTTMRGIGPAYEAKAGRRGVRVAELFDSELLHARLRHARARTEVLTRDIDGIEVPPEAELVDRCRAVAERFRPWVTDVPVFLNAAVTGGQRVLVEGAQGTFLDLDHGTYPFVTSSNTTAGGVCTGLGLGPRAIDRILGVSKAYTTRVGMGPFPSELDDDEAAALREAGAEYGATTGRPRRCGWLDLVALRRAAQLNSLDELVITKLDVLDGRDYVKVVVAYEDDPRGSWYPEVYREAARPVEKSFPGWQGPTRTARTLSDLPVEARRYLEFISGETGVPVTMVSVGSRREDTVIIDPSQPAGVTS
jgi:adenylosuccinate synthase